MPLKKRNQYMCVKENVCICATKSCHATFIALNKSYCLILFVWHLPEPYLRANKKISKPHILYPKCFQRMPIVLSVWYCFPHASNVFYFRELKVFFDVKKLKITKSILCLNVIAVNCYSKYLKTII